LPGTSNALARLRREHAIRPDNPAFVGAAALPALMRKTLRVFPARAVCGCRSIPSFGA